MRPWWVDAGGHANDDDDAADDSSDDAGPGVDSSIVVVGT